MEFNPGDVIHCQVTKADVVQDAGLHFVEKHGRIYIDRVEGLFQRRGCPVQPGDQLLMFQSKEVREYKGIREITRIMKRDLRIMITVERNDPAIESESSDEESDEEYPRLGYYKEYDILPGDILMLDGLQSRTTLNGEIVQVIRVTEDPTRWEVEVERTGERLSISGENLYPVDGAEEETSSESEEDVRRLGNGPVHDKVEPGMTMKLFKLKRKAKMNGVHVKVMDKSAKKSGRWQVRVVDSDRILSIHESNLKQI